jgi:hypothetical protein
MGVGVGVGTDLVAGVDAVCGAAAAAACATTAAVGVLLEAVAAALAPLVVLLAFVPLVAVLAAVVTPPAAPSVVALAVVLLGAAPLAVLLGVAATPGDAAVVAVPADDDDPSLPQPARAIATAPMNASGAAIVRRQFIMVTDPSIVVGRCCKCLRGANYYRPHTRHTCLNGATVTAQRAPAGAAHSLRHITFWLSST